MSAYYSSIWFSLILPSLYEVLFWIWIFYKSYNHLIKAYQYIGLFYLLSIFDFFQEFTLIFVIFVRLIALSILVFLFGIFYFQIKYNPRYSICLTIPYFFLLMEIQIWLCVFFFFFENFQLKKYISTWCFNIVSCLVFYLY